MKIIQAHCKFKIIRFKLINKSRINFYQALLFCQCFIVYLAEPIKFIPENQFIANEGGESMCAFTTPRSGHNQDINVSNKVINQFYCGRTRYFSKHN